MKMISTSEARKKLGELVNQVKYKKTVVVLGRNNKPEALIVPLPEDGELPISEMNAASPSFDFLADEPEIYSVDDLKKRYV